MDKIKVQIMEVLGLGIDVAIAHINFQDDIYKFTQAGTDLDNFEAVIQLELFQMADVEILPTIKATNYGAKYDHITFTYGLDVVKEAIVDYYKATLQSELDYQRSELQNVESDETEHYIETMIDGLKHEAHVVKRLEQFFAEYGITGLDTDDILDDIDDFVTYQVKDNPFIVANQLTSLNFGEMDYMLSDSFYPANILPALKLKDYYTILDMTSYWLIAVLDVEKFGDYIIQERGTGYVTEEEIQVYRDRLETVQDDEFLTRYIRVLENLK